MHRAVICTIHIEPNYRFIKNEAGIAKRMVAKGLLEPIGNQRYTVTPLGERLYKPTIKY